MSTPGTHSGCTSTMEDFKERAKELVSKMTLAEKIAQMQHDAPAIERLGIPAYNWWNEALHGVARAGVATVFPQSIGLAATFDPELVGQIGDVVRAPQKSTQLFSPSSIPDFGTIFPRSLPEPTPGSETSYVSLCLTLLVVTESLPSVHRLRR